MIIKFGVENFKSIRDFQELSLVASSLKDEVADTFTPPLYPDLKLLPSAVVYGANASGKTCLLSALNYLIQTVRHSGLEEAAPSTPFLLDEDFAKQPSRFEIDFILRDFFIFEGTPTARKSMLSDSRQIGTRFHYGFKTYQSEIAEEWLFAFPQGRRQVWFHRNSAEPEPYVFGKSLKGRNQAISEITGSKTLFLSAAARSEHEQLTPLFSYFKNDISFRLNDAANPLASVLVNVLDSEPHQLRDEIIKFILSYDLGATDLRLMDKDAQTLANDQPKNLQVLIDGKPLELPKTLSKEVRFSRHAKGGSEVLLPMSVESRGTRALANLATWIVGALAAGKVLVVDELDSSMHPLLVMDIVKRFNSRKLNAQFGQLIFSTHDTNLLDTKLFRRDQFWFTEKASDGATCVYPLSDFKTRPQDAIEKGYLQGRFGAVPILGRVSRSLAIKEAD